VSYGSDVALVEMEYAGLDVSFGEVLYRELILEVSHKISVPEGKSVRIRPYVLLEDNKLICRYRYGSK
jgi:hypothetical protein